jgi:Ni/Fe-hydrogenase subunit HybB-like protein
MSSAKAIGGPMITPVMRWLLLIIGVGIAVTIYRLTNGLGVVVGMNDGYPFGLWIAFDVVTGTAFACGGYAVAILAYVFNKGHYHPLIRPALLTSFLGYSLAIVSVAIDIGRYWNMWKLTVMWGDYNFNSTLLEVALCIAAYSIVLFLELSPAFLEGGKESKLEWLKNLSTSLLPLANKLLFLFIALGLVLPTMHQSSLGSVMLLARDKLHPLWFTGLLPLLFLIGCISMGYGAVIAESTLSARALGRRQEIGLLGKMAPAIAITLSLWVMVRFADIIIAGEFGLVFSSGFLSILFWLEILLSVIPAAMLMSKAVRADPGRMLQVALMIMFGGALYRFDTYLVAFDPGPAFSYVPALGEVVISAGIVALEIALYIAIIKKFPILATPRAASGS